MTSSDQGAMAAVADERLSGSVRGDEYAVLVLSLEEVAGGRSVDGSPTLDVEAVAEAYLVARRAEIEAEHAKRRSHHDASVLAHKRRCAELTREHEAQAQAHAERLAAFAERMSAHERRLEAHALAAGEYEARHRRHEESVRAYEQAYASARSERARRALTPPGPQPKPPGRAPTEPGPPPPPLVLAPLPPAPPPLSLPAPPTDEMLLEDFNPGTVRTWTARLTTQGASESLRGSAFPQAVAPPPAFVTEILNAVAAGGWTVHHVAEDRATVEDEVCLVTVRYLLRRPRPAAKRV
jgi:hypothetical protein